VTATNGRPTGFDYMRIVLAVGIVCFHSVVTSYGETAQAALMASPAGALIALLVPMFFSLSGFLVAGSLARTRTIVSFLGLRCLRILPALCAEILLSAFVLGPVFTELPLKAYFSSAELWSYLNNIHGGIPEGIHYYLPGVFAHNPIQRVNGQLWTVPGELECYGALTLLFLLGLVKRPWRLLALFAVAQVYFIYRGYTLPESFGFMVPSHILVMSFIAGVLLYLYRDRVPWDWRICAFAAAVSLGLPFLRNGTFAAAAPIAYMTVYLGLLNPRKLGVLKAGDYSYGVYLYGYPIQQAVSALAPHWRFWWFNILVALPLTLTFAAISWHVLEKRALSLKVQLYRMEDFMLQQIALLKQRFLATYGTR
jgi:peptidoglycan/LPS O-acetylase OafA/YrhL